MAKYYPQGLCFSEKNTPRILGVSGLVFWVSPSPPSLPPLSTPLKNDLSSKCSYQINMGASTRETMDISLIKMFIAGPEVSLSGSPTVSPTTVA